VQHLGSYLIKGKLIEDGSLEVLEAMDPVTGGAVLLFRPLTGMPPRIDVVGVLPYELPVADAWITELPFGVVNAAGYRGRADLSRLEAWTRRLLAVLAELEAQGLRHGKLRPEDLWVRGEAVWLAGVGVPWPDPEPDAPRLVAILKALAGEAWEGWRYAGVLEALADGGTGFGEALAAMGEAEPPPPVSPEPEDEPPLPKPPEPPPTVRVKGKKAPEQPPTREEPSPPKEEAPPLFPEVAAEPPPAEGAGGFEEPPEVVRIEEPQDPAFEVVRPADGVPQDRRSVLRALAIGLLLLLALGLGVYAWLHRAPAYVQEVTFEVVPPEARAELVVLSAPEGSRLASGTRFAIPGKVRFDKEGLYTFEVQSEGYKPKTFALEVPVLGGRVTVRLGGR